MSIQLRISNRLNDIASPHVQPYRLEPALCSTFQLWKLSPHIARLLAQARNSPCEDVSMDHLDFYLLTAYFLFLELFRALKSISKLVLS